MEPKISIVVPVYNKEKYIARCMDSLIAQTYKDIEILLVDDGSTDASGRLCDEYAAKCDKIRVIHKENGGLMSAWSTGLNEAVGEYVSFVDSDDWLDADAIEAMAVRTTENPKEIICCNFVLNRGESQEKHTMSTTPGVYENEELEALKKDLLGHEDRPVSFSRCMKLIRPQLIKDNLVYTNPEVSMGEDLMIMLPTILDAKRLVIMENAHYYHYFFDADSMAHEKNPKMVRDINMLHNAMVEDLIQKGYADQVASAHMEYEYLLMAVVRNFIRLPGDDGIQESIAVCKENESERLAREYPLHPTTRSGRLVYSLLKSPDRMHAKILKYVVDLFDAHRSRA